jgi:hypothetical protein
MGGKRVVDSDFPRSFPRRLTGLTIAYGLFAVIAPVERAPTVCPFRLMTGSPCPLCGLTRATNSLFRGEIRKSLSLNPLAAPLWVAAIAWLMATDRRHVVHELTPSP